MVTFVWFDGVNNMEYMTIKEASEKWNLSVRRVQTICNEGMVPGVMKFGHSWAIPKDANKPVDKRIKSGKYIKSWFWDWIFEKMIMKKK